MAAPAGIPRRWTVADSAEIYAVRAWGGGYFGINEAGNVAVTPGGPHSSAIDMKELVDEVQAARHRPAAAHPLHRHPARTASSSSTRPSAAPSASTATRAPTRASTHQGQPGPAQLPELRQRVFRSDEFCPVCMLRKALAGGVESGESRFEEAARQHRKSQCNDLSIMNLSMAKRETGRVGSRCDGGHIQSVDVDLHCPVTLKVISARYLATNRRGFVFCAKPVRRPAFVIQTLPRSSTWQNWRELLLRDGVCRGGNPGAPHQALRPA